MRLALLVLLLAPSLFAEGQKVSDKTLSPKIETPKTNKELNFSQYKKLELKKDKDPTPANCVSVAGVIYEPGTANYDSCMREMERNLQLGTPPRNAVKIK